MYWLPEGECSGETTGELVYTVFHVSLSAEVLDNFGERVCVVFSGITLSLQLMAECNARFYEGYLSIIT